MNATAVEPRYLSYLQSGIYCSCSRWTLYRAVKRGELKAHCVGGMVRFDRLELDRWMRSAPATGL